VLASIRLHVNSGYEQTPNISFRFQFTILLQQIAVDSVAHLVCTSSFLAFATITMDYTVLR